jgi:hypothetical protein
VTARSIPGSREGTAEVGEKNAAGRERFQGFAVHLSETDGEFAMMKGGLLWLIGIPLPIILGLWLFGFLS